MDRKEKRKVVAIEDDAEMIDLFDLILGRRGFEIFGADGGRSGLDLIYRIQPDLILLDLMMPEMDGWEVYQQLKAAEETRDIPVVIVTARAQQIDQVLGIHIARVDDYITKPFSPTELAVRVEKVLNRAQPVKNDGDDPS